MLVLVLVIAAAAAIGYWLLRSSALTVDGVTFKKRERVRIAKWAGTKKPEQTGHSREVDSGPGQTGTILGFQRFKNNALVMVRWDAQRWKELDRAKWVDLREFTARIHPSYLEVLTTGQSSREPAFEPIRLRDGTLVKPGDRVQTVKFAGTADTVATGHAREVDLAAGHTGTVYGRRPFWSDDNDGVVVHWDAQEWKEHERENRVALGVFERIVLAERLGSAGEASQKSPARNSA